MRASFATICSSQGRSGSPARKRPSARHALIEPVLGGVLGVGCVAGDDVGHSECDLLVRCDELLVRARVAALRAQHELPLVAWTALHAANYTAIGAGVPARTTRFGMARLVGINHVALEVGDIDEALAWYGRFFELELRGRIGARWRSSTWATSSSRSRATATPHVDRERHFGLVVDDKAAVRAALEEAGVEVTRAPNCSFRDPWGNHVQVVDYREIQFTKTPEVLRGMGLVAREDRAGARGAAREGPRRLR